MITSIAILVVSVGLFLYWFRYTCLLILSAKTTRDYAGDVAFANRLNFLEVQSQLAAQTRILTGGAELDGLQARLQRDYEVVSYLARHAAEFQVGGHSLEDTMLRIDYKVMNTWFSVARSFSNSKATQALEEMCQIVGYFANSMGERAACTAND
jgi:hypothetical protein